MVQGLLGMTPMLLGNVLLFFLSVAVMAFLSPLLTIVALFISELWPFNTFKHARLLPDVREYCTVNPA